MQKHRVRNALIGVGVLLVAGAVVLFATGAFAGEKGTAAPATPSTFVITGSMTVDASDASEAALGGSCVTDGGYSDIRTGTQVTVKNATGTVIALGALDAGHTVDTMTVLETEVAYKCVFGFTVPAVPEGEAFYSVEVAGRGELRYQRADLGTGLKLTL